MNVPKLRFPEFSREWEEKKLLECLTTFGDGIHGTPNYSENGEFYFINGNNLENGKIIISENTKKITRSEYEIIKRNLNDNTLLISINGTLGNVAFYNNEKIALGKSACFLNLNQFTNKVFCYYVLLTKKFHNYIYNVSTGTTIKNLSPTSISDYSSCFPCLAEQQKIADFLSNVDSIISAETKILNALQKKKKALIQKLFTQQLRFKSDDGTDFPEWEEKKVFEFAKVDTGANNTQDKVENGTYPFYVRSPIIYRSNNYIFDFPEAVLTVGDGVGTGKVFHYVQGKFDCHQRVYVIHDFENVLGKYFYFYFSEKFYARVKPMSAKNSVDSVRREMITDMKIPIPCKAEQQKIAECLSSMDSLIQTQQKVVTTWQQRKKALLQQMFI